MCGSPYAPTLICKVPCGGRTLEDKIIKAGGMADAGSPFDAEKFRKALFGKDEAAALKSNVVLDARKQKQN